MFDEALYKKMTDIHEVFDSDAARVMVLVGMEMTNHTGQIENATILPNNKLVVKDHTHGVRRSFTF